MDKGYKEGVYEIEFEQLNKKEIAKLESEKPMLRAKVDVSVVVGNCTKTIGDILNLKEGDVVCLDKTIDEDLDVRVNNKTIASGESILIDDKISIRISEFKKSVDFLK